MPIWIDFWWKKFLKSKLCTKKVLLCNQWWTMQDRRVQGVSCVCFFQFIWQSYKKLLNVFQLRYRWRHLEFHFSYQCKCKILRMFMCKTSLTFVETASSHSPGQPAKHKGHFEMKWPQYLLLCHWLHGTVFFVATYVK